MSTYKERIQKATEMAMLPETTYVEGLKIFYHISVMELSTIRWRKLKKRIYKHADWLGEQEVILHARHEINEKL